MKLDAMTPQRAAELQAAYAEKRRQHRESLGLAHSVGDRNGTEEA